MKRNLLLAGEDQEEKPFFAGQRARIDPVTCTACGACLSACRFRAIACTGGTYEVDPLACEGCGVCGLVCPSPRTITFAENQVGTWAMRRFDHGWLVHARLGIAQDSSGKLVALLRRQAEGLGERSHAPILLVDGPPGIGCPVHAAMGGVDLVVAVTEPSASGEHDLLRLLDLAHHFQRRAVVVLNKADLAPDVSRRLESVCAGRGVAVVGRIPFDPEVPRLLARGALPLAASGETADAILATWRRIAAEVTDG